MLIALATLFLILFGGSGLEFYLTTVEDSVKDNIADKARQEIILDASKALSKQMEDIQKDVEDLFDDYVDAHEDIKSTPQDFDAITEKMIVQQQKLSSEVLKTRKKMHAQMSETEWTAVFSAE